MNLRTAAAILLACAWGCASGAGPQEVKPAEPVKGRGLTNAFHVSSGILRGGQPTPEGMRALEGQGVRTVINLRAEASDAQGVQGTSLKVVDVPLKSWKADHDTLVAFLRAVTQASAEGKCYFH